MPGGQSRAHDRALLPRPGDHDAIDLNCAAASAPPGIANAYAEAGAELPAYLGGHGYFPAGLPQLQAAIAATYEERGLPTDPGQILVTPGALSAASIVAQAFTGPGDRVIVESPVYPNATLAIRHSGARLTGSPVDPDGWDLDAAGAALRQTGARLAYLIPDFQNPTGHLMTDAQREEYAGHLRRAHTVAVVDEAHVELALDGQTMPRPFASYAADTVTIGSSSKSFWGGLRLGWIRAPRGQVERITNARVGLDLGAPVMEQLVLTRLLADRTTIVAGHRSRLHEQRASLAAAVTELLPEWHVPDARRRAGALVRAPGRLRDCGHGRGGAPRSDRRSRPRVRGRGRARPLRPDPVDAARRRAARGGHATGVRLGRRSRPHARRTARCRPGDGGLRAWRRCRWRPLAPGNGSKFSLRDSGRDRRH